MDSAIAQSEVWSKRNAQLIAQSKQKNDFTFWMIFDLSPNLGLSETLSERLILKVKWPNAFPNVGLYHIGHRHRRQRRRGHRGPDPANV